MPEVSKPLDPNAEEELVEEIARQAVNPQTTQDVDNDNDDNHEDEIDVNEPEESANPEAVAVSSSTKKKKSKRAKLKKAFGAGGGEDGNAEGSGGSANPASKLTTGMVEQLLEMNPSLKSEVAGMDKEKAAQTLKKLDVADLLTGMVSNAILRSFLF